MNFKMAAILAVLSIGQVTAAEPKTLDLNFMDISAQIPVKSELAKSAFNQKRMLVEDQSVPSSIGWREKRYTMSWLNLNDDYFPRTTELFDEMALVRNIQDQDDGIFLNYGSVDKDWWIKIIDGRKLEYAIYDEKFRNTDMLAIFQKVFRVVSYADKAKIKLLNSTRLDEVKSYGVIFIPKWGITSRPIEWYRDGDIVLFIFIKESPEPPCKGDFKDATLVFGGAPSSEARPFFRFENSNREELAKEYLKLRQNRNPKVPQANAEIGLPIQPNN